MGNSKMPSKGKKFEDFAHNNDLTYWYARDLMNMLEYVDYKSFRKIVDKAILVIHGLEISIMDNIIQLKREIDGVMLEDYKLTRFACYLVVMNSDIRKPMVARAQAYFASLADLMNEHIQEIERVERIAIRKKVTNGESSLSSIAKRAGVEDYALFRNAGYRGMYNMNLADLKRQKGISNVKRTLLDYMGSYELAANLFRVKQTEEEIKNGNIFGQVELENTALNVGQDVRNVMIKRNGKKPEDLPIEEDIKKVKSELKKTKRRLEIRDKDNQKKKKTQ